MTRVVTFAGALLVGMMGTAYSGEQPTPDLDNPEMISAGRQLFLEKHCSHCHGADGNGGVNLTNRDLSDPRYVFEAIADGQQRGSLRMPAWRDVLTDTEIWQTTAYVIALNRASR